MRSVSFVLAAVLSLSLVACKRDSSGSSGAATHDTVGADDELSRIARLDDGELYERALRTGECSTLEGIPCADPYTAETRCELALRAVTKRPLRDRLALDARSADRARRGAALRVLTDSPDEASARAIHDALIDRDPAISCAAARYGTWFAREDAARLAELETTCDGKAIIAQTRAAIEAGKPGQLAKGGVTCAEIRAAR